MRRSLPIATVFLVFSAFSLRAMDRYVRQDSPNPAPPYSNWDTAAHVIQDAIDASDPGDTVIVTNGTYNTGGRVVYGILTNRVAITKPLTVESVNGPAVTIIEGYQIPGTTNGDSAIRCVYMTNNTTLIGFTLTHGATADLDATDYHDFGGGGAWCENLTNSVISNCVIIANSAAKGGGGVLAATLFDCIIATNSTMGDGGGTFFTTLIRCRLAGNYAGQQGGGTYGNSGTITPVDTNQTPIVLNFCTIVGNSSPNGAGAVTATLNNCVVAGNNGSGAAGCHLFSCTVVSNSIGIAGSPSMNCIVYYNQTNYAPADDFHAFCCTTPASAYALPGNITNEPAFVDLANGDYHLQPSSPCINSGDNSYLTVTNDFWDPPDLMSFTYITNDFDGNPRVAGGTVDMGAYEFQPPAPANHYVWLDSPNPAPPYTNWDTAAHVIQDAVDASDPGDTVIVTNGLYNTGGHVLYGTPMTNRVAITKPLTVESVNGPDVTIIEGYQVPGVTNGPGAVRGVYMTNNTTLIGFTITHGATDTNLDFNFDLVGGGGVYCESFTNSVLSNCVIIANSAFGYAGGVLCGTLNNCVIANNSAYELAGGAAFNTLNHCVITNNYCATETGGLFLNSGAGAPLDGQPATSANYCVIAGNSSGVARYGGAGASTLNHCLIIGNQGAGAIGCRVFNCTVVSNSIGIDGGQVLNSIVYYNDTNYPGGTYPAFSHTCTTPLPNFGAYKNEYQNIADEPLFVDAAHGNFRLQPNSPCINSGYNGYLTITNNEYDTTNIFHFTINTNDFDGNPRVVGGTVDIGAYEFQTPASTISYAWLQQYGFPMDGSADYADADGDGMNNWQEWRAGTVPTDPRSLLVISNLTLNISGATLTWQSQTNVPYYIQRATDPGAAFSTIQSNITGWAGSTSYTDTNATGAFFYRVGVQ